MAQTCSPGVKPVSYSACLRCSSFADITTALIAVVLASLVAHSPKCHGGDAAATADCSQSGWWWSADGSEKEEEN